MTYTISFVNPVYPHGILIVDDERYVIGGPLEYQTGFERNVWTMGRKKVINTCDCCGRADIEDDYCSTIDEMVEKGWIIEESKYAEWEKRQDH